MVWGRAGCHRRSVDPWRTRSDEFVVLMKRSQSIRIRKNTKLSLNRLSLGRQERNRHAALPTLILLSRDETGLLFSLLELSAPVQEDNFISYFQPGHLVNCEDATTQTHL